MARIADSIGRVDENSGYSRLFGDDQLGRLFSRVQAAVIRTGNELEELLWQATPYRATLEDIIGGSLPNTEQPIFVVSARKIAEYARKRADTTEKVPITDLLILDTTERTISVVELKDGDTFDTKKSAGELVSARAFTAWIQQRVNLPVTYHFCSFNQRDKAAIVKGVKGVFTLDQVMTGAELCVRLGVDPAAILILRQNHQVENREYFIRQILAIPSIRARVEETLRNP